MRPRKAIAPPTETDPAETNRNVQFCNRRIAFVLIIMLTAAGAAGPVGAVGQEFIALENWSYRALERFETLGLCVVPEDRPLTRAEFIEVTEEIAKNAFEKRLSARDRYNLERLEKEYTDFSSRRDPQHRYDPPTFYLSDAPVLFEGDVDIIGSFERQPPVDEDEALLRSNPDFKIHFGDRLTYNTRHRWILGPENAARARNEKPSRREKSFKGLTSLFERSYVIYKWDKVHAYFGREAVDWGASDLLGSLITPGARHTLDQFGFRLKLKSMRLSMFHAQLSPVSRRYLAGHRLEVRFKGTVLGLNETVLYHSKQFDPLFAFPLSSFYANAFNERINTNNNIIWSIDVKRTLFNRLTLFGSFLVDDFQFEREGDPDKIAFDVGGRFAIETPIAATVRATYRFVDVFTYSHIDSVTNYVSGEGEIFRGDVPLGGAPGPDSDSWRIEVEVFPRRNVVATGIVSGQRLGGGNDYRSHEPGTDPNPQFPLPVVERTRVYGARLTYEFDRNRFVVGEFGRVQRSNIGGDSRLDDNGNSFRLAVHWEFL
jgi:hypothetical protein